MKSLERRIKALEVREEDPLVLSRLFPPHGVPRSRVKFTWVKDEDA